MNSCSLRASSNGLLPQVSLSSLQNEFYTHLPNIKGSIFDELMESGYFLHRPDYVRQGFVGGGIFLCALFLFLGNALVKTLGIAPAPFVIAGVISRNRRRVRLVHAGAYVQRN